MQVNILEAKNRLSELVKSALNGEEVVIANRGKPVVRLVAVANTTPEGHRIGSGAAILAALQQAPLNGKRRTDEEIEAAIAEARSDWD
jgi:prevent-host-death family protein